MSRVASLCLLAALLLNSSPGGCQRQEPEVPPVKFASTPPAVASLRLEWPSFSPDGSVAVCLLRNSGTSELYRVTFILDAPAMRPRPLPVLPGAVEGLYGVSWHPNSKEIAFTLIERDSGHFGIWLFDLENNQARPLVRAGQEQILQCPLFSPDGKSVVFRNAVSGRLLVCNVATGEVRPLPDIGKTTRSGYAWGGDGNRVWASTSGALFLTMLDRNATERIDDAARVSIVVSSPNGKALACLREGLAPNLEQYHLCLFDAASRSFQDLGIATNRISLGWRPDGKVLAYVRDQRIWVYDLATNDHHAVTPADVEASFPFWHPRDGTLWCVVGNRAIARLADDRFEEVFSLDKTGPGSPSRPASQATRGGHGLTPAEMAATWKDLGLYLPDDRQVSVFEQGVRCVHLPLEHGLQPRRQVASLSVSRSVALSVRIRSMQLSRETIRGAFRMHGTVYAVAKNWDIPYHIECWSHARAAFDGPSLGDFEHIYRELKNHWQVFRGASEEPWSPIQTFDHLLSLPSEWRDCRLSQFTDDGLATCWEIIDSIAAIKPMRHAPSVVAVSKFLHFWNPRLFVIVDDAFMWRWVFARQWLKRPIHEMRQRIQALLPQARCPHASGACDLLSYLAVVRWSAEVVRANPEIGLLFAEHVREYANSAAIDLPLDTYEAAAMEWLLLGLVEMPPGGVTIADDTLVI